MTALTRITSYNILAQCYVRSSYFHTVPPRVSSAFGFHPFRSGSAPSFLLARSLEIPILTLLRPADGGAQPQPRQRARWSRL